ncbi:MAG: hypothetical protein DI527_23175 [Chelatococcus sp.]|nr:MAG: hypothetical protein DI527_23175 [Chelatococcus sp.]
MTTTPRLSLPLIAAGQAQKHVPLNDALTRLDALVHLVVDSRSETVPPALPTELSAYIVPPGATGVFADRTDQIALYEDGGWIFLVPRTGWQAWVADEAEHHLWTGTEWRRASPLSSLGASLWGVNGTADATTRFVVQAQASLFDHAGAGHQVKLNKASAGDTVSLLFQDGYSGRAEIGLAGDDDFHCKVSADGSGWIEAMAIDRATGEVALPATPWAGGQNLLINGDFQINQRGFAGGALAAGAYGFDRWKAGPAGATLSLAGYALTLASGAIVQPVEPALWGVASFAGLPLTLSVEGLAGGALSVSVGSASGVIASGSGRRGVTLTPAAGDTGPLSVSLTPAGGAVTLMRIKLEFGRRASVWGARPATVEEALCCRYHWRPEAGLSLDAYQAAGGPAQQAIVLPVRMRAVPSSAFAMSGAANVAAGSETLIVLSRREARASVAAAATGRVQASFGTIVFDAEL